VRHEGYLHSQGIDSLVVREAPEPLETMKQAVLGGGDAPLFGGGVGAGELGEAEGALVEEGAYQKGEVGSLGGGEKRRGSVDRVANPVVPWHLVEPPLRDGCVIAPSYSGRFRFSYELGGYASGQHSTLTPSFREQRMQSGMGEIYGPRPFRVVVKEQRLVPLEGAYDEAP
jgi:hypothetical protein